MGKQSNLSASATKALKRLRSGGILQNMTGDWADTPGFRDGYAWFENGRISNYIAVKTFDELHANGIVVQDQGYFKLNPNAANHAAETEGVIMAKGTAPPRKVAEQKAALEAMKGDGQGILFDKAAYEAELAAVRARFVEPLRSAIAEAKRKRDEVESQLYDLEKQLAEAEGRTVGKRGRRGSGAASTDDREPTEAEIAAAIKMVKEAKGEKVMSNAIAKTVGYSKPARMLRGAEGIKQGGAGRGTYFVWDK